MQFGYWEDSALAIGVIIFRLVAAGAFGAVLGFEREVQNRNAGLKTHIFISVAAATFTIITIEIYAKVSSASGANADPIRIIEAVTAGVAFIAAGAIIQNNDKVRGLTTGAGLWLAGAIGVATGAGQLGLALVATIIGLITLTIIRWIERWQFPKDKKSSKN